LKISIVLHSKLLHTKFNYSNLY